MYHLLHRTIRELRRMKVPENLPDQIALIRLQAFPNRLLRNQPVVVDLLPKGIVERVTNQRPLRLVQRPIKLGRQGF
jgi:hypothetical protein